MRAGFIFVFLGILSIAVAAFAGANQYAKVAVHVLPHIPRTCADGVPAVSQCTDIIYTEPSSDVNFFPLFFDLVEYQGFDYGITWPGSGSCVFTSCSDLTIGSIVAPGDWVAHAWATCQPGPIAIPGWGWISDQGQVCIIPRPGAITVNIGDCSSGNDAPIQAFCCGIGGSEGENPCQEPPPACEVRPATLDFGIVGVGYAAEQTFTVRNTGGGLLRGEIGEDCAGFTITSGSGLYALVGDDSVVVTIRFEPELSGPHECVIDTDVSCADVVCVGIGAPPPVCMLAPTSLDFGTVFIGEFSDHTFAIRNLGGSALAGEVTEACAPYSIESGAGPYNLEPDDSVVVTVRFAPTVPGEYPCSVAAGVDCPAVLCTGIGEPLPLCLVTPAMLDFGTVTLGEPPVDTSFVILNAGGGTLTGHVAETCGHYSILAGAGPYNLGAGETVTVTVRFEPQSAGTHTCEISTGQGCDQLTCTGISVKPPACKVCPANLDFETILTGEHRDLGVTLKSVGLDTLTGFISATCDEYSIQAGGGSYWLPPGDSVALTVRFQPDSCGLSTCTIATGSSCDDIECVGVADGVCRPLVLDKQDDVGICTDPGSTVAFTLSYRNTNPLPATGVTLADRLPAEMQFLAATGGGAYDPVAHDITWDIGTLDADASGSVGLLVEIDLSAPAEITLTDTCTVFCNEMGPTDAREDTDVCGVEIPVYVDIRPRMCPNRLVLDSPLMLLVTILGEADRSVRDIDVPTLRLSREGLTASLAPSGWIYEDAATPFTDNLCGCHKLGADGFEDLKIRLPIPDVASVLELAGLEHQAVTLVINGNLAGGEPVSGRDCIVVEGESFDVSGDGIGFGPSSRRHTGGGQIVLTFHTSSQDLVVLEIFDVRGRAVRTLVNETRMPGSHVVTWDLNDDRGSAVPTGIYFACLRDSQQSRTQKIILLGSR
ncbi:MAG: choice-of-anchor D domain-containing protein [Candidatus Eisenbacteria bacterium]